MVRADVPVSELLPHFPKVVDEVAFVKSMTTDRIDHSTAQFTFVTGRGFAGFPSLGSWAAYGLGAENQNLPAFIAMEYGSSTIGSRSYSSAWLPRSTRNPDADRPPGADV